MAFWDCFCFIRKTISCRSTVVFCHSSTIHPTVWFKNSRKNKSHPQNHPVFCPHNKCCEFFLTPTQSHELVEKQYNLTQHKLGIGLWIGGMAATHISVIYPNLTVRPWKIGPKRKGAFSNHQYILVILLLFFQYLALFKYNRSLVFVRWLIPNVDGCALRSKKQFSNLKYSYISYASFNWFHFGH